MDSEEEKDVDDDLAGKDDLEEKDVEDISNLVDSAESSVQKEDSNRDGFFVREEEDRHNRNSDEAPEEIEEQPIEIPEEIEKQPLTQPPSNVSGPSYVFNPDHVPVYNTDFLEELTQPKFKRSLLGLLLLSKSVRNSNPDAWIIPEP